MTKAGLTRDSFLGGQLHLWQPAKGYRAATDPVLLAASCPAKPDQSVLELGCGVGAAILCLEARVPGLRLTGVEVQSEYAELARRNGAELSANFTVVEGDLQSLPANVKTQSFDHVILNPPYYGPGQASNNPGRELAMREDTPLDIWVDTALRRAGPKGTVTVIHLADRLTQLLSLLNTRAGLVEIKPISARALTNPKRVIVRLMKGRANRTILHNPLVLHEGDRHECDGENYSKAANALLRHGEPLIF